MSPPTIHKIADTKPVFPCWLYTSNAYQHENEWVHHSFCPWHFPGVWKSDYTHWCHSETRPTVTPEAEPVFPAGHKDYIEDKATRPTPNIQVETVTLHDGSKIDVIRDIEAVRKALFPRPACDCVEKVAEEICAPVPNPVWMAKLARNKTVDEVAAILRKHFGSEADELRRRDEEIARLTLRAADRDEWQEVALNNQARAEKAEALVEAHRDTIIKAAAEVAALKAENENLKADWQKQRRALNRIAHPEGWPEAKGHNPKEIARRAIVIGMEVPELPSQKEGDYDTLRAKLADSEQRLKEAEEDGKRIDWLDENMSYNGGGNGGVYSFKTPADVETGMLRQAIDAARNATERSEGRSTTSTGGGKP